MATLKQQLINKYPEHKELIEENWNWLQNGTLEWGEDAFKSECPDLKKTQKNIYMLVEQDVLFEIEQKDEAVEYVVDGAYGGLGIPMNEFLEVQKLSCEPHGIYGD